VNNISTTTPNLQPLKISPDDYEESIKLDKQHDLSMPYLPSLDSPDVQESPTMGEDDYNVPPTKFPFLFQNDCSYYQHDHGSNLPHSILTKSPHRNFVLKPRHVDTGGKDNRKQKSTSLFDVGADFVPTKRPRVSLFVSLDREVHPEDSNHVDIDVNAAIDVEIDIDINEERHKSPKYQWYKQDSSRHPLASFSSNASSLEDPKQGRVDCYHKVASQNSVHHRPLNIFKASHSSVDASSVEDGTQQVIIALPRVFRPTIPRTPVSDTTKLNQKDGLDNAFVPSRRSAFSSSFSSYTMNAPFAIRTTPPTSS